MNVGLQAALSLMPIAVVFLLLVVWRWPARRAMPVSYGVAVGLAWWVWGVSMRQIAAATMNGLVGANPIGQALKLTLSHDHIRPDQTTGSIGGVVQRLRQAEPIPLVRKTSGPLDDGSRFGERSAVSTIALHIIELVKSLPVEDQQAVRKALAGLQPHSTGKRRPLERLADGSFHNPNGMPNDDPVFQILDQIEQERHRMPARRRRPLIEPCICSIPTS